MNLLSKRQFKRRLRLANGREMSALEIQEEYLSKARDFAARRALEDVYDAHDSLAVARQLAVDLWKSTGYYMIILYAARRSVPTAKPRPSSSM